MARQKKLVLSGYYGYSNAGDEMILSQVLKGIKKHIPAADTAVLYRKNGRGEGFRKVNRYNPFSILKVILWSHVLVMGGGSLLQDGSGKFTIYYYLLLMGAAKVLGKKIVIFNQGIGPINFSFNRMLAGYFLSRTDLVIVRDSFSVSLGYRLSRGKARLYLGADPVFNIDASPFPGRREGGRVGLVFRNWKNFPSSGQLKELSGELKKRGLKATLLKFHPSLDRIRVNGCETATVTKYDQIFEIYANVSSLIGMRLHSLILGCLFSLPMLGIDYDPKVRAFCAYMGIPSLSPAEFNSSRALDILERQIERKPDYSARIKQLKERAEGSWRRFADFAEKA